MKEIDWSEHRINVNVTRDQVKSSPAWDPLAMANQVGEQQLHRHLVGPVTVGSAGQKESEAESRSPGAADPRETRAEIYARLAASTDSDEIEGLVGLLLASYAQSGSDTGDLLLGRAHKAMEAKDFDAAARILDLTIAFLPDWAEGWNARATLRYLDGDYDGSMADIAETLKREPRHRRAPRHGEHPRFARQARRGAESL